jgi:hypothetical protein
LLSSADPSRDIIRSPGAADDIQVAEVLSRLFESLEITSKLIQRYYEASQVRIMPWQFLHETLSSLRKISSQLNTNGSNIAGDIMKKTMEPLEIPHDTLACDFAKLFTGSNLRLEIVGIVLATAARTALNLPHNDSIFISHLQSRSERRAFAVSMLAAADTCVSLCDKYLIANDIMTWLRIDHQALTTDVHGSSSRQTWYRIGQLLNDVMALNLHREPEGASRGPLFLEEIRSRLFTYAYRCDKAASTVTGRPPRLSKYYCNRKKPLHLHNDLLVASDQGLQQAINSLSDDGWSMQESFPSMTWLRARYVLSTFREDILQIEHGFGGDRSESALR